MRIALQEPNRRERQVQTSGSTEITAMPCLGPWGHLWVFVATLVLRFCHYVGDEVQVSWFICYVSTKNLIA